MNSESLSELIWHFAGHLHLTEDYAASRLKYQEISYQALTKTYQSHDEARLELPEIDVADLASFEIRISYTPKYDSSTQVDWAKIESTRTDAVIPSAPQAVSLNIENVELPAIESPFAAGGLYSTEIHTIVQQNLTAQLQPEQDDIGAPQGRDPIYTVEYADELGGQVASIIQQNVLTDKDFYSDSSEEIEGLHHIESMNLIGEMIDAASEFAPDILLQPGTGIEHWTTAVAAQDEALESGERTGEMLALGRYVNGELQEQGSDEPDLIDTGAPELPERVDGSNEGGQVAELGANQAKNMALIADLNEASATMVVMGDYFKTNAVIQANVLQNQDHVLDAGTLPLDVNGAGNRTDNIATFAEKEVAAQIIAQQVAGDLKVNIDFVDGDFVDVKALTQRNYLNDGDITVQTNYDAYAEVLTGGNEQANATRFLDWGKQYDIIIVLGDYHSANIISQVNILLDNDLIGQGGGSGSYRGASAGAGDGGSVLTGQNALHNEAAITQYGATTFATLTGEIEALIAALNNQEVVGREAWSSLHGAVSGSLDVLFVTGDYYDLNVISQINVIADADLAIQMNDGTSLQWVSAGGNSATNMAEIIDAGGMNQQYLGGSMYEDSILVQANLVSDSTESVASNPTSLVPELVAFLDQPQEAPPPDGESWTSSTYSNHDSFGHVLS